MKMEAKIKEEIMRAELEEMTKLYGWKPNGFAAIAFGRGWMAHDQQTASLKAECERLREADKKMASALSLFVDDYNLGYRRMTQHMISVATTTLNQTAK